MNVLEHLSAVVQGMMNLRIITQVGDATVKGTLQDLTVDMPGQGSAIVTNIDLVQGDITTVTSPSLRGEGGADVQKLHTDMVEKAQDIVARNVALLKSIVDGFGKDLPDAPAPTAKP